MPTTTRGKSFVLPAALTPTRSPSKKKQRASSAKSTTTTSPSSASISAPTEETPQCTTFAISIAESSKARRRLNFAESSSADHVVVDKLPTRPASSSTQVVVKPESAKPVAFATPTAQTNKRKRTTESVERRSTDPNPAKHVSIATSSTVPRAIPIRGLNIASSLSSKAQASASRKVAAIKQLSKVKSPVILLAASGSSQERLEQCIDRLSATTIDSWRDVEQCTHVVVPVDKRVSESFGEHVALPSIELMVGIAYGKLVVSDLWLERSCRAKALLDEMEFIVSGDTSTSAILANGAMGSYGGTPSPLVGNQFCVDRALLPTLSDDEYDCLDVMLSKRSASKVFKSLEAIDASEISDRQHFFVLTGCAGAYCLPDEAKARVRSPGARVLCQCFVRDSVSTWSKRPYWNYLLYGSLLAVDHLPDLLKDARHHKLSQAHIRRLGIKLAQRQELPESQNTDAAPPRRSDWWRAANSGGAALSTPSTSAASPALPSSSTVVAQEKVAKPSS